MARRTRDPVGDQLRQLEEEFWSQGQTSPQDAPGTADVPDLLDFVAEVSPTFEGRPGKPMRHLAQVVRLFERALAGEQVRAVICIPPRHGKTELCLHAIAWSLLQNPALRVGYLSATAALARKKSLRAKKLTSSAGIKLSRDSHSKSDWRTTSHEGGCWAAGVDGQITGEGFDLCFVDDPHKGRSEAESQVLRDKVHGDWFKGDVTNRMSPDGSVFVIHTRWHPDDLAGRLIAEGWESVVLPAISPEGYALWPEQWPLAKMQARQKDLGGADGYEWRAQFMGDPLPSGTTVFQGATFGPCPPLGLARIVIGLDFAYSTRNRADHSVAVVMAEVEGKYYILNVVRVQKEPRAFLEEVRNLIAVYPSATCAAYVAATESGGIEFFREAGIPITGHRASAGKLERALATAAAWNTGDILLPNEGKWRDDFISEVKNFTGEPGGKDDQVDALAAAYDSLRIHKVDWEYLDRLATAWPAPLSL